MCAFVWGSACRHSEKWHVCKIGNEVELEKTAKKKKTNELKNWSLFCSALADFNLTACLYRWRWREKSKSIKRFIFSFFFFHFPPLATKIFIAVILILFNQAVGKKMWILNFISHVCSAVFTAHCYARMRVKNLAADREICRFFPYNRYTYEGI